MALVINSAITSLGFYEESDYPTTDYGEIIPYTITDNSDFNSEFIPEKLVINIAGHIFNKSQLEDIIKDFENYTKARKTLEQK